MLKIDGSDQFHRHDLCSTGNKMSSPLSHPLTHLDQVPTFLRGASGSISTIWATARDWPRCLSRWWPITGGCASTAHGSMEPISHAA